MYNTCVTARCSIQTLPRLNFHILVLMTLNSINTALLMIPIMVDRVYSGHVDPETENIQQDREIEREQLL